MAVKGKVLVVDDDKELLEELHETLVLSGYEVCTTVDSTSVKENVRTFSPDIIVLDLKMEQMNGFEVAEDLSAHFKGVSIPVIAMTGFFREDEHLPLLNICGIKRCIKKPFSPLDIIGAIEETMKGRK
jgi:DNA-binding response OmpR family regulator